MEGISVGDKSSFVNERDVVYMYKVKRFLVIRWLKLVLVGGRKWVYRIRYGYY